MVSVDPVGRRAYSHAVWLKLKTNTTDSEEVEMDIFLKTQISNAQVLVEFMIMLSDALTVRMQDLDSYGNLGQITK